MSALPQIANVDWRERTTVLGRDVDAELARLGDFEPRATLTALALLNSADNAAARLTSSRIVLLGPVHKPGCLAVCHK